LELRTAKRSWRGVFECLWIAESTERFCWGDADWKCAFVRISDLYSDRSKCPGGLVGVSDVIEETPNSTPNIQLGIFAGHVKKLLSFW